MLDVLMNEYAMLGVAGMWLMYMAVVLFGAAVYGVGCLLYAVCVPLMIKHKNRIRKAVKA